MENQRLWLQGMYVYDAIYCCVPVLRAFSKAKKPNKYPKEPYPIYREDTRSTKQHQKSNDEKAKAMMDIWMVNINKKFETKNKESEAKKDG